MKIAEQQEVLCLLERRKARQMADNLESIIIKTIKPAKATFLDLPPEVLTYILLYLPFSSVMVCQGVNRHLQALISESAEIRYYIHLGISGSLENLQCGLPVSECLDRLLARERRWEELRSDFDKIVDVPDMTQLEKRRLSGGVFSLLYADGVLREMQIPDEADQEVEWKDLHPEQVLIHTGLCVLEQDLHILITARPRTVHTHQAKPRTIHEVRIHLNQLSTGEPHPDAQRVISFDTREEFGQPWTAIECVGDNLVLVLRDRVERHKPNNQVYIYEWKTGELKMRLSAPFGSYRFPLFLITHMFLLPNVSTGELEYWKIPRRLSETTSSQPYLILSLPQLGSNRVFHSIYCRAEPNPTNGPQDASQPFYTDPYHAIAIFNVFIQSVDIPGNLIDFTLFVHRSSLVGYLDTFSAFTSSEERPKPVPYDNWGPPACRWFNHSFEDHEIGWIAAAFGQRYVASVSSITAPLLLLNFNPINVAKVSVSQRCISETTPHNDPDQDDGYTGAELTSGGSGDVGRSKQKNKETSQAYGDNALEDSHPPAMGTDPFESHFHAKAVIRPLEPLNDPDGCFEYTVYSSLPYTMRYSRGKHTFGELLLNEENIIGLRMDDEDRIEQIHVFHYG
ncbi:hypothetical protein P691DRAFT_703326 [Macrolepiota fuliginosa MF-IS2]|uniref:F-box domain-containing protein n=1 Tax=Macrolepiota fuliginosa MF-IS2 TaxID=1400762 RepID=A0A9P6C5G4_9AGAR|nr:hypothetical protein P691DRAFT_703326 [Macrolepiota fuliginosa MF-IS2]